MELSVCGAKIGKTIIKGVTHFLLQGTGLKIGSL